MKSGKPALPANVHLLKGNPSQLSAEELAQRQSALPAEASAPPAPAWLAPAARAEWERIAPLLVACGLLTAGDHAALAGYCQAFGEWRGAVERINALQIAADAAASGSTSMPDGPLIDRAQSGYRQVSALAQVRDRAFDRLMRTAQQFGLTPASRVPGKAMQPALPGMPVDPMAAFLEAGSGLPAAP